MVASLPVDIVLEIAAFAARRDVLSLSSTSSRLREILLSSLYESVDLKSSEQCRTSLAALSHRPETAYHVRHLALRPNTRWTPVEDSIDESSLAGLLKDMLRKGCLAGLQSFVWGGLEILEDDVWRALKESCPSLRVVSTTVGSHPLSANNSLFGLSNLTGFGLSVNTRRADLPQVHVPEPEEFPTRMWDMLVQRCPNLERLTIEGITANKRIFNIRPFIHGRWPKLRTLELSAYISREDIVDPEVKRQGVPPVEVALPGIEEFLAEHSSIETLGLEWHWINIPGVHGTSFTLPRLPSTALLNMKSFSGLHQQIAERVRRGARTQENNRSVTSLKFMLLPIYPDQIEDVCVILRQCPSLESLSIWLALDLPEDVEVGLACVLEACPNLSSLHLMTLGFPPERVFSVKNLSKALYARPTLKSITFNLWHRYLDEAPVDSATRLVRDHPNLDYVASSYLRPGNPRTKHIGSYDVTRMHDMRAAPSGIIVHESGRSLWQREYRRNTRRDL